MTTGSDSGSAGPDGFPISPNSPCAAGHLLLNPLLDAVLGSGTEGVPLRERPEAQTILGAEPPARLAVVHAGMERVAWLAAEARRLAASGQKPKPISLKQPGSRFTTKTDVLTLSRSTCVGLLDVLCQRKLPYADEDVRRLLAAIVDRFDAEGTDTIYEWPLPSGLLPALLRRVEEDAAVSGSPEVRASLARLRTHLYELRFWAGYGKTVVRLDEILGAAQPGMPDAGEVWADQLSRDLGAMAASERAAWQALLEHAPAPGQGKPPAKWVVEARKRLAAIGTGAFVRRAPEWLSLVGRRAQDRVTDRNGDILKGLAWYCGLTDDPSVSRVLAGLAEACFGRAAQTGLLCSRAGKACLWSLGALPGTEPIAELARLKLRVKSPWALNEITKALDQAAGKAGMTLDEVAELAVPTYSLDHDGCLRRELEGHRAEVSFPRAGKAVWSWTDPSGKALAALPAGVAKRSAQGLKELKREVTDVEKMLSAQRESLDRLLRADRSWPVAAWRERFLDHPLMLNLARRLIWTFGEGDGATQGIWLNGELVDAADCPLGALPDTTRVRLWHPIGSPPDVIVRWRAWLEGHGLTQPFKQAHREVYLLTDAEMDTATYSHRFAAHILKQHQLHALCQQRGWKHGYLGTWDSDEGFQASLDLPAWSLRAEFWLEGADGDASEAGVLLYVSTDQVRFCGPDGEPRHLSDVPALAFTEAMRDVDLFVGVCSVGNDPNWQAEAGGQHADYWRRYSFGDLAATAETRRDILSRLLPRLRIGDRCRLSDRFLVVQGGLRAYKIHLGSGNVLMEPDDRYLCIVADRGAARKEGASSVFLPFEGDDTLALILSKAFMLADDRGITDPTIVRQIQGQG